MSTSWTLTAGEICTDALEHLGVIGDGETASAGDMQIALKALDGVLKELPLRGYTWPALSAEVSLTWASVQAMALPTDYYGYPVAWTLISGYKVPLRQIPHAKWIAMLNRTATGATVQEFYIDPAGVFNVWPVPPSDPVITLQYQKIVPDAVQASSPTLPQYWINPLGYGVANELVMKFGIGVEKSTQIANRWAEKKAFALESSAAYENICFDVAD